MRFCYFVSLLVFCIFIGCFSQQTAKTDTSKKYHAALKKAVSILKNKSTKSKADAIKLLNRATELVPSASKAWCILGKYYQGQRNLEKGLYPLKKCSQLDPTISNRIAYGTALFDYGSLDASKNYFSDLYEEEPTNPDVAYYYALSLAWTAHCEEAEAILKTVRPSKIDNNCYYCVLYTCYTATGNTQMAKEMDSHRVHTMSPKAKIFNVAVAQLNSNRLTEALQNLQQLISDIPDLTEAYWALSKVYQKMFEYPSAVVAIEKAVSLFKRGHCLEVKAIEMFTTLYDAYVGLQPPDHNSGVRAMEQVLSIYPHDLTQLFGYYHIKNYISSLKGIEPLKRRAMERLSSQKDEIAEQAAKGVTPPLTPIRASVMASMDMQTQVNEIFGYYLQSVYKFAYKHGEIRSRKHRDVLRVGLFSADVFYNHPMMHLMRGAFKLMRGCEVILINVSNPKDNMTSMYEELSISKNDLIDPYQYKRGKGVFNQKDSIHNDGRHFRLMNIENIDFETKAESIRALDLDILIDLMGYTQNNEAALLARRPAAIQVNYLGFPAQMTNSWIQFNQQDSIVSPPQFSKYYPDKLVYLPYYYACNHYNKVPDLHPYQSNQGNSYLRKTFKVPQEGTLYCFPNQLYKITSDLMDAWANILRRHPMSYLWLLRHPIEGEEHIKSELMARGIYVGRILFSDFEQNKVLYMVRTSVCDIILDSASWSAGATGLDAYWSGVPVVNLPGDRTVERLGISLMRATYFNQTQLNARHDAQLSVEPPLIVKNLKDYEDVTVRIETNKFLQAGVRFELMKKVAGDDFDVTKTPVVRHPLTGGQFDIEYWLEQWVMSFYAMYDVMYLVEKPWVIYAVSVAI